MLSRIGIKAEPLPTSMSIRSVGLVGVTGHLGTSLLPQLTARARAAGWNVLLFTRDSLSHIRSQLLVADVRAQDIACVVPIQSRSRVDILIVCAGITTQSVSGPDKKHRLFSANHAILTGVLNQIEAPVAILATNPTTALLSRLILSEKRRLLGIGVENDNLRFRATTGLSDDWVLVGGHTFEDLVIALRNAGALHPKCQSMPTRLSTEYARPTYLTISETQDLLLADGNHAALEAFNQGLVPEIRWWAAQRVNTILNRSCYSASDAVLRVLDSLTSDVSIHNTVVVETNVNIDGIDCVLGWPFCTHDGTPLELTIDDRWLEKLRSIGMKYQISPNAI